MNKNICNGRREFLVKSTATAGGLILSLAGLNSVEAQQKDDDDVTLKLDAKSPLSKVGGTLTFDYKGDKILILRKSETEFEVKEFEKFRFVPFLSGVNKNKEVKK